MPQREQEDEHPNEKDHNPCGQRDGLSPVPLHQQNKVVTLRLPSSMRVCVDEHLTHGITATLNRHAEGQAGCELIGPPKINPNVAPSGVLHSDELDTGPTLAMTSSVQGEEVCASLDRY